MTLTISKARLVALVFPFLLYLGYLQWYYGKVAAYGEEVYLQFQRSRFEAYYANGNGFGIHVYAAIVTVLVLIGTYELTAAVLSRWLDRPPTQAAS